MITDLVDKQQKHTLVDIKKQQWAKERGGLKTVLLVVLKFIIYSIEELAQVNEMFTSSHHHQQSSSHQQIKRTSIRTFYSSNVDLSQTTNCSSSSTLQQQQYYQQQQHQQHYQNSMSHHQQQQQLQQMQQYAGQNDMSQRVQRPSNFENNNPNLYAENELDSQLTTPNEEAHYYHPIQQRRGRYLSREVMDHPRYNTTSMMGNMPGGNRRNSFVELIPTTLQTAKARVQQQQHQQYQRIRSPSLPAIRHREYVMAGQGQKTKSQFNDTGIHNGNNNNNNNSNNTNKIPLHHAAIEPAQTNTHISGATTVVDNGNPQNRFNNITNNNNSVAVANNGGRQPEEDTSGYLSDSPKNTHTPDIWFNDGASQISAGCSTVAGELCLATPLAGGTRNCQQQCMSNQNIQQYQNQQQHQQQCMNRTYVLEQGSALVSRDGYCAMNAKMQGYQER